MMVVKKYRLLKVYSGLLVTSLRINSSFSYTKQLSHGAASGAGFPYLIKTIPHVVSRSPQLVMYSCQRGVHYNLFDLL